MPGLSRATKSLSRIRGTLEAAPPVGKGVTPGPFDGTPIWIVRFGIVVVWIATWLVLWDGTRKRDLNRMFWNAITATD